MNYKALDSGDLRKYAKSIFGSVLKVDLITDDEIIEELKAYDSGDYWKHLKRKNKEKYHEHINT